MTLLADIAVDAPLNRLFTYRVPESLREIVRRGARVKVPFGRKTVIGVCVNFHEGARMPEGMSPERLRDILAASADIVLPEKYLKWLEFAADYYVAPPGIVFAQALPPLLADPARFGKPLPHGDECPAPIPAAPPVVLLPEQSAIVAAVEARAGAFFPALLHGVTGSGKTEVYLEIIAKALTRGQSALFLVPEIGLTPQTLRRLRARFPEGVTVMHSALTQAKRRSAWLKAYGAGKSARIVVGTRSALFAPLPNLGVIVVDEEHDASYKQEEGFRYHARDLAVARASCEGIPVILGSATPSLESYHRAREGRYAYFRLATRPSGTALPEVKLIDGRREREQTGSTLTLTKTMLDRIAEHLAKREQVILFVGQRGFARNALCLRCLKVQNCPNCSVGMKFHAPERALKCHYCGLVKPFTETCESCGAGKLTLTGSGIQSVEGELRVALPGARVVRVDSDAFPSPSRLEGVFEKFAGGEIDVIVGTQMMSKGHDFANVGFVGVAGIDAAVGLPDFRAAERCFQTVVQVAGRAGRATLRGRVLVQSDLPGHPSLKFALEHDYEGFAANELACRAGAGYPPFKRLIQIRFSASEEGAVKDFLASARPKARSLARALASRGVAILGPVEMPLYKLRGRYRAHLLLKLPRTASNAAVTEYVLKEFSPFIPRRLTSQVDVDPASLM